MSTAAMVMPLRSDWRPVKFYSRAELAALSRRRPLRVVPPQTPSAEEIRAAAGKRLKANLPDLPITWQLLENLPLIPLEAARDFAAAAAVAADLGAFIAAGADISVKHGLPPDFLRVKPPAKGKVGAGGTASVILTSAASIIPERVGWHWDGYLPAGKLIVVAGTAGVAKTTVTGSVGAACTVGGRLPDGTRAPVGDLLIWSGEDDPADTLIPRLMVAGADMTRVHLVQSARDEGGKLRPFDPAFDMDALAAALAGRNVKVFIIDPLVSAVSGDDHKNAGTRRALQPVVDLAASVGCAVIGISHFSKGTQGRDPTERVTGSLAYGALARVVLAVAKVKPDDAVDGYDRVLVRAKSNCGPDGGGFRFRVEQVPVAGYPGMFASAVRWGPALEGQARDILAAAEIAGDPEETSATDEAVEFLRETLAAGPMRAGDVQKQARGAGIQDKPLRTARGRLGIKPEKRAFSGGWWWSLPLASNEEHGTAAADEVAFHDEF